MRTLVEYGEADPSIDSYAGQNAIDMARIWSSRFPDLAGLLRLQDCLLQQSFHQIDHERRDESGNTLLIELLHSTHASIQQIDTLLALGEQIDAQVQKTPTTPEYNDGCTAPHFTVR